VCELPEPPGDAHLLGPLLRRSQRVILGAHTGHGKSTLIGWAVACFVNRCEFLEWTGVGGRVLVLDLEQGARSAKRVLREVGLDKSDDVDYVLIPDGLELDRNEEHVDAVEQLLRDARKFRAYDLVVLDAYYKAARIEPNDERQTVDLMRLLDRWRSEYEFALAMTAHPRKPPAGQVPKLTMHDLAGSGALTRGAEVVLGLERVFDGGSRLHFWKDRDGELPAIGTTWNLLYDEAGFRRDPKDEAPARDLEAEAEAFLRDHPGATTNDVATGIEAGRKRVSDLLKSSDRFEYEPGPNNSRRWVARDAETHRGHPDAAVASSGDASGGPSLEGHAEATQAPGGPSGSEPLLDETELAYLDTLYDPDTA
jgi:hypothetical protein